MGWKKANARVIVPTAQNEVEAAIKRSGLQPEQNQAFQRCEPLRTEQRVEAEIARNEA